MIHNKQNNTFCYEDWQHISLRKNWKDGGIEWEEKYRISKNRHNIWMRKQERERDRQTERQRERERERERERGDRDREREGDRENVCAYW